ncbi:unnamed protein product [Durusdinium trenchii]|uniref:PDZ domain-containing protein n=1 Tax=Durusdinium trenchii TaxID=1381693 RepID=A0ABP0HBL7_9DINO
MPRAGHGCGGRRAASRRLMEWRWQALSPCTRAWSVLWTGLTGGASSEWRSCTSCWGRMCSSAWLNCQVLRCSSVSMWVGQRISFRVELEEGRPKVKEVLSGDGPPVSGPPVSSKKGEPFEKSEVCLVKLEGNFGPSGLCFGLSRAKLPEVQFIRPEQSQFWRRNEVHVGDRLMRIEGAHYTFVLGSEPERRPSELSEGLRQRPVELSFLRVT